MKAILFSLFLVLPAAAQRKIWTWAPSTQSPDVAHHVLLLSSAPSGVTVILYVEMGFAGANIKSIQWKADLISAKGETLKSLAIPEPTHYPAEDVLRRDAPPKWKCVSIGKAGAVIADSERVIAFTIRGGTTTATIQSAGFFDEQDFLPMEGGAAPLAGWFKRNKQFVAFYNPWSDPSPASYYRLSSLELWSAK